MEQRPLGSEEHDEKPDKKSSKKKWGGTTLSKYLGILRQKEEQSEYSTEDSESERPRRMRRLFGKLFPSIVERPTGVDEPEQGQVQHEFNHDTWFSWVRQGSNQSERPVASGEVDNEKPTSTREEAIDSQVQFTEQPVRESSVNNEELSPGTGTSDESIAATVPFRAAESVSSMPEAVAYDRAEDMLRADTLSSGSRQVEREVVIERGGALLPTALVGLEYLARKKADKKLESRMDKKIDAGAKEHRRSTQLQQELERVVKQNREQLDELKRAREGASERISRIEQFQRPDVRPEAAQERPAPREIAERTRQVEKREAIKPRNIMERVADAAEHDMPVERAFERSHEVKDDQSAVSVGASSVESVISGNPLGGMKQAGSVSRASAQATEGLPVVTDEQASAMYKQAAERGFWSAVVIMVLGLLAWLVIK